MKIKEYHVPCRVRALYQSTPHAVIQPQCKRFIVRITGVFITPQTSARDGRASNLSTNPSPVKRGSDSSEAIAHCAGPWWSVVEVRKMAPLSARTLRFLCLKNCRALLTVQSRLCTLRVAFWFLKVGGINSIDIIESIGFDRFTPAAMITSHFGFTTGSRDPHQLDNFPAPYPPHHETNDDSPHGSCQQICV